MNGGSAAIRLGAWLLLVAAVVLAAVALLAPTGASTGPRSVPDPGHVELPAPGTFGGTAVVYGPSSSAGSSPKELGCRLLYSDGKEQGLAKLRYLTIGSSTVTVGGRELAPLFRASSYPDGSYVSCPGTLAPLAVGGNDVLGGLGTYVKGFAGVTAALCAALGLLGLLLTRRRAA